MKLVMGEMHRSLFQNRIFSYFLQINTARIKKFKPSTSRPRFEPNTSRKQVTQANASLTCCMVLCLVLINVAYRAVAMRRPRDRRMYQGRFRQRLGKRVPATTNRRATIEVLLETSVSTWSVPRSYLEYNWGDPVSSVRESVKRALEHGSRGIAIVGAVTRKRLIRD
jgi:hypothetical protein